MSVASKSEEQLMCVRCQHVADKNEKYCIRCGAPLVNRCSDEKGLLGKGCTKINRQDAAYCSQCGEPTFFHKAGLIEGYSGF